MYTGLSSSQAEKLLKTAGFNEIPEKKSNIFKKILKNVLSPIVFMLLLAAILSFVVGKKFDSYFILILLLINSAISIWQEDKADNAIKKLNQNLKQKIKVFRDQQWVSIYTRLLVTGDIISLSAGEIVPSDGKIIEANHLTINESSLTGESLPKDKKPGDLVYSGSFITTGVTTVEITSTGIKTKFGQTLFSVERVIKQSLLEKDILNISKFLTALSVIAVFILTGIFIFMRGSYLEILTLDLSLIIAGIPISLPTVMTLIIEIGVLSLAAKKVIVRRLSALEDLANVNYLLTDKTGTLTKNQITVQDIYAYDGFTHNDVLSYAAFLAKSESEDPIDKSIIEKVQELHLPDQKFERMDFIPADSERKRSTIIIKQNQHSQVISMGAPQIIENLCSLTQIVKTKFQREVNTLAANGYRTLAIATVKNSTQEREMQLVGLLALSDTLRPEAKSVVEFLKDNGIDISMVTGDNQAIASNIASQLALSNPKIVTKNQLDQIHISNLDKNYFQNTGVFAEILPEDKFKLVQRAKNFFVVASNGDGINDLPAIKAANVGIAVKSAVSSLKATADIVLLSDGISVIKDAIIESRKIFERIYIYSLYRISESLRLIVTIAVLGILYGQYPMTPLQLILIALLNDIPIISLAFDKVKVTNRPAKIEAKKRFILSSLFGLIGVVNSLLFFFLAKNTWHLDWNTIQTMYFLKLTISGHLLIYVAHTKDKWWKFLPSKQVIWATSATQLAATLLAFTGFLMPKNLDLGQIIFIWLWAFFWMQIGEITKYIQIKLSKS